MSERILVIKIYDVSIHSEDIWMFFCIFYAAVHHLIENPVRHQKPCISPTHSISLQHNLTFTGSQSVLCRVF